MSASNAPTARERVETMLSVLPWLGARDGATVEEICARFGTDPDTLLADLRTVWLNVEPEVGPDNMIDLEIDGDWVSVRLADYFRRPPRLDHNEALLLLAAGTALQHEAGIGEVLHTAVTKLAASLGPGAVDAVEVDLGPASPEVLAALRQAIDAGQAVEMAYFTWGRDALTSRVVDPWALRSIDGQWYLTGWCHDRRAPRHFRADRIHSLAPVGPPGSVEVPEQLDELGDPQHPSIADGELVELRVRSADAWVVAPLPVESWEEEDDDVVLARLRVHGDAWLDRLLLALGPQSSATVVATGESLAPRRTAAARAVLARHGVDGDGEPGSPTVRSSQ